MTPLDDPVPDEAPDPLLACWRCGLETPSSSPSCRHCAAPLRTAEADFRRHRTPPSDGRELFVVIRGFIALLVVSIVHAGVAAGMSEKQARDNEYVLLAVFEGIDTLIVLITWACCTSPRLPAAQSDHRLLTWLVALPALTALIGVNILYHAAIRAYVKIEWLQLPEPEGVTLASVVFTCLQPGVVEELFFRYLLLGVLRRHAGVHGAVLVSAAMFAVCHVHVLLSMPYLFVVGVVLGYARVGSRSLVLPMALHFLHNLIVTALEGVV